MKHEPNIRCACSPLEGTVSTHNEEHDRKGKLVSFEARCSACRGNWRSVDVELEERV